MRAAGIIAALWLAIVLAGCGGEERRVAQTGDTVSVHYRGTLDSGEEFDSSRGRDPLTFTVGEGQVIDGFDAAVTGMAVGESKTVRLEPDQAYGARRDDLVITVPKAQAPDGLEEGQQVLVGNAPAVVTRVTDDEVTVDANHPLAGEALTFEIELVSIQ
jgi:peptidylprolyl isomerase